MGCEEDKKEFIPKRCKNYACLKILEDVIENKLKSEKNFRHINGMRGNYEAMEKYLKVFCIPDNFGMIREGIRRHLNEIDIYFETGIWERIY